MKDNDVSGVGIWSLLESRCFVTIIYPDMVTILFLVILDFSTGEHESQIRFNYPDLVCINSVSF